MRTDLKAALKLSPHGFVDHSTHMVMTRNTPHSPNRPRLQPNALAAAAHDPAIQESIRRVAADANLTLLPFLEHPLDEHTFEGLDAGILILDADEHDLDWALLAETLPATGRPTVIMLGSEPADAVRAYDLRASDFVLKPFPDDRLFRALCDTSGTATRQRRRPDTPPIVPPSRRHMLRLLVKVNGRILVLPTERVDWIEAAGIYVRLHTPEGQPLIRRSMQELENRLDPDKFIRIHRSAIINVDRLHDLQPLSSGDFEVTLLDGTRLVLSRRYRHRVAESLGEPI
jgi:two-component system LytT family response regulator